MPIVVFLAFLKLGLSAFGGPVAHLGYFRAEFVEKRRWLGEAAFAELVALCQFLPGPASSQVGFGIGLERAGLAGAGAAWCGFTLPSAVLMAGFAGVAGRLSGSALGQGVLHGLKMAAAAIVVQAVVGMGRGLCPDWRRRAMAAAGFVVGLAVPGFLGQLGAIALGAVCGLAFCGGVALPGEAADGLRPLVGRRVALVCLAGFAGLLVAPALLARGMNWAAVVSAFVRPGALVFGGGHVVLPLLRQSVVSPGWIDPQRFLAGYGAAQAVPGPLFTFAAFLGASLQGGKGGVLGACVALAGIFLPGLLLFLAALPAWHGLRRQAGARAAMAGVNAAVVGLLGAALVGTVLPGALAGGGAALSAVGVAALAGWLVLGRVSPLVVVLAGAALGVVFKQAGAH